MPESIHTITDPAQFEDIFYKYFLNSEVSLKTKSGNMKITFMGFSDGMCAFKIPFLKNMPEMSLILTRKQEYTIYAAMRSVEKQEDDVYILKPEKMQVITAQRRDERKAFGGSSNKDILYVTNLISDFIIQNALALEVKKCERIKEIIMFDLTKLFKSVKIYFCSEGMLDPRMKFFYEKNIPISIPEFGNSALAKDAEVYNFFTANIFAKDYYLINRKIFVSEVSVPIAHNGRIPYGYIQVNHTGVLNDAALKIVQRMAVVVNQLMKQNAVFPISTEKLIVSDASKSGLGIVFNDRRFIRYFKEKSYVCYDLMLPDSRKVSILSIVRNITLMENKIIKVGCEISDMDEQNRSIYHEFLEKNGLLEKKNQP